MNADQIEYWNGPAGEKWAAFQSEMDRTLADATAGLLALGAAKPGERVLDVGCGAGETSLLLAKAVGPAGAVTGVDISAPLLAVARRRGAGMANAAFVEADAARHPFAADCDLVASRFGVMFFDDPTAAFANIRTALKPGGRLAFICWRPAQENQWVTLPAAAARDLLPPSPPADPLAPGPFAFADRGRVETILSGAGFSAVAIDKLDGHMDLGADLDAAAVQMLNIGPLSRALADANADATLREKVRLAVRTALQTVTTDKGVRPGLACWLVSARNP
jgi:SAM-dependent methyltransferase